MPITLPARPLLLIHTIALACLVAACGGGGPADDTASTEAVLAKKPGTPGKGPASKGNDGGTSDGSTSDGSTPDAGDATLPPPPTTSDPVADGSLAWSDPATWGGVLPPAGAEVVIPAGKVITLDIDPPALAGLRIEGTLRFARRDTALSAGYINVSGALEVGSASAPFAQKAVITLTGAPQATNDGVARGLNVRGGRLELHGVIPQPVWTKLNEHANAGTTALTLKDSTVNWRAGDTIAIAPTDWYGVAATERLTLSSAHGTQLGLTSPLSKFRWGKLQHVTNAGMSLTPDPTYVPPATPAPTTLDERAAVANLTRNIVIQGIDDGAWQTTGFGAHVMVMNLASKVVVDGVEFRRMGQAGTLGRYPFHWHMLSYDTAGNPLGDATGHVLKNSAIWNSSQRCVVLHGTNGVQVLNNICQDVKGHAFFLEDAVERRNVFDGNLALMTRMPAAAQLLQKHEGDVFQAGPSGFWLTNPDNVVRNNHAGDAHGNGFWMAFPRKPLGLSAAVPILPDRLPHGVFEYNTAHTARGPGIMLEWVPMDAAGNVTPNKYIPTIDGSEDNYKNRLRFTLKGMTSFKNLDGGYRNRVSAPDYLEWVTADNYGVHFAGQGDAGVVSRALMIGTSLNNASPYPTQYWDAAPAAFATYHSTFALRDNTAVGFPFVAGKSSGVFKTDDYYTKGVDKGLARNTNNRIIDSNAGSRTLPPSMDGKPLNNRHWTYAGALWDANGYWGPKQNFWVYDVPFLTAGANCQWVEPAGQNGKSCDGQYYGVGTFQTDFDSDRYTFRSPIEATRIDPGTGAEIGKWSVADGTVSTMFAGMRHFAARTGGMYALRFPGKPAAKWFRADVSNVYRTGDSFVFGVSFDGTVTATGYTVALYRDQPLSAMQPGGSLHQYTRWFADAGSLTEVMSSAGNRLWQDRANNMVWIKIQGGLTFPNETSLMPNSDTELYRTYSLILYSK